MEQELSTFRWIWSKEYLSEFGLSETGLNRLVSEAYKELNLISYLTAGVKEVRAWTITKGTRAPQAAAVIHTDFEKHFIKAEIVPTMLLYKLEVGVVPELQEKLYWVVKNTPCKMAMWWNLKSDRPNVSVSATL